MVQRRGHELAGFLGREADVELLDRVLRVEPDARGLTLRCSTLVHRPQLQDYYGTVVETVLTEPTTGVGATIRLDWCTDAILRVRTAPGERIPDGRTAMVVEDIHDPVAPTVTETDAAITVGFTATTLTIERAPIRLTLTDDSGRTVWRTRPVDLPVFANRPPEWNTAEGRWIFHHRYGYPAGWTTDDMSQAFLTLDLAHDERVHGFGESFGSLDKRETAQRLWVEEAFGNTSPASYKRVPFYFTSRGYGMFVNSSHPMTFRVGDLDHTALSLLVDDTDELDLFLIHGPDPKDILPRYTRITGPPALPPIWSFGLWMSRITYGDQAEVEQVARDLRAQRIPTDVIHIDTGWFAEEYVCDLRFGPQFPDPAGMTATLAEQGFKVSLWQWPLVNVHSPMFEEARRGDHLVTRASGHVYTLPGGFGEDAGLLDYTRPETVAWVGDRFRALLELGVAAIKVDYGEGAPPDGVYANATGAEIHNLYPLLYQRAVWEATASVRGADDTLIWGRSGWAGSQRYPVHWSGDGVARYEDLACVLRSMLSFGLSGFPFYSHDIGGFVGTPEPDLYVRWAQLGLLSSHARAHGSPPREPWAYGDDAAAAFRDAAELRYRLLPYLWTEAIRSVEASLPLARPLLVEYPNDPVAATIDDAYLLGSTLLVAPLLEATGRRRVYLPAGTWIDLFTDECHAGPGFIDIEASLDRIPVFVRGDGILPMGPVVQHTGESGLRELTIGIWAPTDGASYVIRWPDQDPVQVDVRVAAGAIIADVADAADATVELHGIDGAIEPRREDTQRGQRWIWDLST